METYTGNGTGTTTPSTKIAYETGSYRVQSTTSGSGAVAKYTYDAAGSNPEAPASYTSPQGSQITYSYRPGDGNLVSFKEANATENRYDFDYNTDGTLKNYSQPNLTTSTSGDRVPTTFTYTGGNLTGIDYPAPLGDVTMAVDTYSRVTSMTDGKGQTTRYGYDNLDRLAKITFQDGTLIVYDYDGVGNQTRRSLVPAGALIGQVTSYAFDALNRLTSETKPTGTRIDLHYDQTGNLRFLTDPGGTTEYRYNPVNLLTALVEPGGATTSYQYDNDNSRTRVTYPNGVSQAYTYNAANQVKTIKAASGAGAVYADLTYDYKKTATSTGDDSTLRSAVTDRLRGETTAYTYGTEDQLTRAQTKNSAGSVVRTYGYGYDANSNRTSATVDGVTTSYTYDAAGLLKTVGSGPVGHDANGNLTAGGGLTLGYNDRDQTTSINGVGAGYEDNDQAQRDRLDTATFTNTGLGVTATTDGAGTTDVTREETGQLAALRHPAGGRSYPLIDALGTVIGLTDATGALTDTFRYDPYGKNAGRTGSTPNPWRFTGEHLDPAGLYKIGMRYYAPDLGRWTQPDPARHFNFGNPPEAMPYAYVGNNPTNYTDPTGLAISPCQLAAGGLVLSGVSFIGGTALLFFTIPSGGLALVGTVALYEVTAASLPLAIEGYRQSC